MRTLGLWLILILGLQDEDGQRNTSLLKLYPKPEDLIGRADELAKEGKYSAALEIYAEACDTHPNHLVPIDGARSAGVGSFVLERVLSWPPEGRAAYQSRYDPIAREEFERAQRTGESELLDSIVERYPLSSVVDDALVLRANFALDAGDPDGAARALERVLAGETDLPIAVVVARLGLAYSLGGRRTELQLLVQRTERTWAAERVWIRDTARPLLGYLQDLLRNTRVRPALSPALEIPSWEMIGGGPTGTRLAESGVVLGTNAWRYSVPLPSFEADDEDGLRRLPGFANGESYNPLFPAVSDGIAYVHNEYAVFAINLFGSGSNLLWAYRTPVPAGILMFEDRVIHTTSVADGRVFANLVTAHGESEDQLGYVRVKFPFPKRALFALDAYTGKLLWKKGGQPRTETLEENATFATAPTPEGDRLYVGAVRQKLSTDPFEHYLVCLDASTGRTLWSTFVASGLTEINLFGNSTRESLGTPVAIAGDLLFYGTNHGVIAAVEKKSGRLRWTYRYAQLPVLPTRSIYVQKNRLEWWNAPPVVSGNQVVVGPTDSRYLYALEAATGRRIWRILRDEAVRVVYGVRDRELVVGGEELHFYDWATGKCTEVVGLRSPGVGRGVVAQDAVYVPTRDGLATIRLEPKEEADFRRWTPSRQGGNVVVVDGAILRAGADFVEAFYDRRGFEKEVEEALKRDSDHPLIGYRCAVRYAQSRKSAEALALFEKVLARVEGSPKPDEERLARACRMRLFALRLELGAEALRKRATAEAKEHLSRAVRVAPDTSGRLAAVLLLADVLEAIQAPEKAIRELYALLEVGEEIVAGRRVSETVRGHVDDLIGKHGKGCFAPLEREAEAAMEKARREGTPEGFLAVARRYPNSLAAETAMQGAARSFRGLGRTDDETAVLREFLRDYPQSRDVPAVHVHLVLTLEGRGQFAEAAPLLRRMIRNFPEAKVQIGESQRTAREFAEERLASEPYRKGSAASARPSLRPPLSLCLTHPDKNYTEAAPLRIQGAWPGTASDRWFVNYGSAVAALSPAGTAWSIRVEGTVRFAHFYEDSLLIGTDQKLVRLNPADGREEWSYPSRVPMRGFALAGSHVCFFTGDPRNPGSSGLAAVDAGRGALSWFRTFDGHSNSPVQSCGEWAVFLSTSPARLYGFEVETGRHVLAAPLASGGLGLQLVQANEQIVLVSAPDRSLEAYELPEGKLKWRTDLRGFRVRALETNATWALVLGVKAEIGETPFAALIDLRTGKFGKLVEGVELGDPRYALLEEDRAFVVSREGDRREVVVRELGLQDLKVGWSRSLGEGGATLAPPASAQDHIGVLTFDRGDNGKFGFSISLLDRKGARVQNIRSEFQYERPPSFQVANGALLVTVEATVQVYK